jgi:hypothetical protein
MSQNETKHLYSLVNFIAEIAIIRFLFGFFKFLHNRYLIYRNKDFVLLSHFGLGDQLIIGNLINRLSRERKIILPVDSKYFDQLSKFYSYNPNVRIESIGLLQPEFYPRYQEIRQLRKKYELPVVDIGRNVVFFLSFFYRASGVSKLYYLAGWGFGISFINISAFTFHCKEDFSNLNVTPYAYVDHHVGTNREIPSQVFMGLKESGFDIKFNDMNLTLIDQLSTIVNAQQLHFVPSAPFCLALVMPCRASVKIFYEKKNTKSVLGDEGSNWLRAECV